MRVIHRDTTRVMIDPTAFDAYRCSPQRRTTLPRLILGLAVVAVIWTSATLVLLISGSYLHAHWLALSGAGAPEGGVMRDFITTPAGILISLASFAGIWIGVWAAMRFVHRERIGSLLGVGRRISRQGFAKGFAAVAATSLLSEIALLALHPGMARGSISLAAWLGFLVPVTLLAFLQTSSEEVLFRGYLQRGLANRFRSPLAWALVPTLLFTTMHWSTTSSLAMNLCILVSIGAFALVLALSVYATGNLGAAFGAHLGNNLFGFLLISHQDSYDAFALFKAQPLESADWSGPDAVAIAAIGVIGSALTALLLLHPRSPLRIAPDACAGATPAPLEHANRPLA